MSKQYFWPLVLIILGIIISLTMLGYLPMYLLWFWPVVMLLTGLGALLVADRDDWISTTSSQKSHTASSKHRRKVGSTR